MPILLDAFNVLHVVGVLPPDLAGIDLEELADLIAGSRFRSNESILVCDGTPRQHGVQRRGVHVRFAGPGRSADETIVRLVRRSTAPRRVTVVTSDREIVQQVRRRRATVVSSERFLSMLVEDHDALGSTSQSSIPSHHPADRRQVDAWLRLFELEGDQLLDLEPSQPPSTRRSGNATSRVEALARAAASAIPTQPLPGTETNQTSWEPRKSGSVRPSGRNVVSALEARTLAEIDPASLDDLDPARLLEDPSADSSATRIEDNADPRSRPN